MKAWKSVRFWVGVVLPRITPVATSKAANKFMGPVKLHAYYLYALVAPSRLQPLNPWDPGQTGATPAGQEAHRDHLALPSSSERGLSSRSSRIGAATGVGAGSVSAREDPLPNGAAAEWGLLLVNCLALAASPGEGRECR